LLYWTWFRKFVLNEVSLTAGKRINERHAMNSPLAGRISALILGQVQARKVGQGQPQVGDITEIIGAADLHDVDGLFLTVSLGFHQPHNPSHAPTSDQRTDAKVPLCRPQSR
jgi:hypothetical protein